MTKDENIGRRFLTAIDLPKHRSWVNLVQSLKKEV